MSSFRFVAYSIAAAMFLMPSASAQAATVYWDTNGATAGCGNAGGNLMGSYWSTSSAGTVAVGAWLYSDDHVFSAGTDGVGTWDVYCNVGNHALGSVTVEEGNISLTNGTTSGTTIMAGDLSAYSGSSLTVATNVGISSSWPVLTLNTLNGSTINITGNVDEYGSFTSGALTITGSGMANLSGVNAYSGATTIDGGATLVLGNASAIGTTGSYARGFTLKNGKFDVNGQLNISTTTWAIGNGNNEVITLGGVAGATMEIKDSSTAQTGFGMYTGSAGTASCIVYDATNNPGTATISSRSFVTTGASDIITRLITVGDSTATDVELDFTGAMLRTGVSDGKLATLEKAGAGTMRISAANYFPYVKITEGTLIANSDSALGTSRTSDSGYTNIVYLNGGTLQAGGSDRSYSAAISLGTATTTTSTISGDEANLTLTGVVSGSGNIIKAGTKTLTLSSSANSYTGTTYVQSGVLAYGAANAIGSGAVTVSGGELSIGSYSDTVGVVTLVGGSITGVTGVLTGASYAVQSGTISAILGGSGALTKTTAGTVLLAGGTNTYSGGTVINGGALVLGNNGSIGMATSGAKGFTVKSGVFDINGQLGAYGGTWMIGNSQVITLGGEANATMEIKDSSTAQTGFGMYYDYTPTGGSCIVYDATNNPGTATISAKSFQGDGASSVLTRKITVGDSSATAVELDFTGALGKTDAEGGGNKNTTLVKAGAGAMRISAANNLAIVQLDEGILIANHNQALGIKRSGGTGNKLIMAGGTLQAGGADRSFSTSVTLSADTTSTISGDEVNLTLSGIISGSGNLIKDGTKTLTLSGTNTGTGNTTINAGELALAAGGAWLLDINNVGSDFSQLLGAGALTLNGALAFDVSDITDTTGSWAVIASGLTTTYNMAAVALTVDGTMFTGLTKSESGNEWSYTSGTTEWKFVEGALGEAGVLSLTVVPEPGAIILLATGLIGLIVYAWRKRR